MIVAGDLVLPGDVLHDHDGATVLDVQRLGAVCTARVRYVSGQTGVAYFGAQAQMSVSRPAGALLVTCRPCSVCGESARLAVDAAAYGRWLAGAYVQDAFPAMPVDDRELLVSGTHPDCWDSLFADLD